MKTSERLRETRRGEWERARRILERAEAENRYLTPTEDAEYKSLVTSLDELRYQIERAEEDERAAADADVALRDLAQRGNGRTRDEHDVADQFRSAVINRSNIPIEIAAADNEVRSGYQPGVEQRDLTTSSGSGLRGTSFWGSMVQHMVDSSAILAAGATVLTTESGENLMVPKSTAFSSASIVTEGSAIPESDPTLGTVTLGAYKYGFLLQITRELAEDVSFDIEGFIAREVGIAIGNGFGAHAITGTGTGQPRGILTDATLGVTGPTGTATSFGTQSTAGQGGDLLIDLAGSLAEPYQRSASAAWLMRNSTLNALKKLKTSAGEYVFDPDVIPGTGSAGTLLGKPVYLDPTMPAIAAGAKSILYGDISRYWVRQVRSLRFERSEEYAFNTDLITFRGLARLDGALIDTTGAVKYFQHSAT